MTDLGKMKKILGIRVERHWEKGPLKISQGPYIDIILTRFHMQNANPVSTPLNKSIKLTPNIKPTINVPYAKAIGLHMYAVLGTWPNLAFTIQHLSQFTMSFGLEQWTAVKHVFRYLKGTQNGGIAFKREANLDLEFFANSDYANWTDALSIGRYMAILRGGAISWSPWKQKTVALSTMETEYMALTEGIYNIKELGELWAVSHKLIGQELALNKPQTSPEQAPNKPRTSAEKALK